MKAKLLTLSLLLTAFFALSLNAQEKFNGTIVYDMKFLGDGLEAYQSMFPKSQEFHVKEDKMMLITNGGMMAAMMGDILVRGDEKKVYGVKHAEKKYFVMSEIDEADEEKEDEVKVETEDEEVTILGYKCQKYKVITTTEEGEHVTYIWATKELPGLPKNEASNIASEHIDGLMLKMMQTQNQGGMMITTVMVAKEVEQKNIEDSFFDIPADYAETDKPDFGG